jgi:hypothetical protein
METFWYICIHLPIIILYTLSIYIYHKKTAILEQKVTILFDTNCNLKKLIEVNHSIQNKKISRLQQIVFNSVTDMNDISD